MNGLTYETPKSVRPGGPFLGVQSEECDEGIALYQVVADSPADKGGLREGDILTHADGKQIKTHNEFIDFLNEHKPGDAVRFKVIRGKSKKTITVTLGTRPGR
jgi:S1-C subfamily serine protease